jgi:hypothetical protein
MLSDYSLAVNHRRPFFSTVDTGHRRRAARMPRKPPSVFNVLQSSRGPCARWRGGLAFGFVAVALGTTEPSRCHVSGRRQAFCPCLGGHRQPLSPLPTTGRPRNQPQAGRRLDNHRHPQEPIGKHRRRRGLGLQVLGLGSPSLLGLSCPLHRLAFLRLGVGCVALPCQQSKHNPAGRPGCPQITGRPQPLQGVGGSARIESGTPGARVEASSQTGPPSCLVGDRNEGPPWS